MKDADRRLFSQRTKGTRVSSTAKTVPCPYFILPAFLLASWFAVAQDQAALTGVVVDPKGASIPGAKLTLTGKATGETRKAVADGEGRFDFKDLPPGKYSLKAMMKGFEEVEMLTSVGSETPAPLRVKMRIRLSEEITVTADRPEPPVSPERNADAVKFDDDLLRDLPASGQNILPVLSNFLSPAAQGVEGPAIVVDGMESSRLSLPTVAIRRVQINKNPYSAEFRQPGKGRIEVITREGSPRHFHGSAGFFGRNSVFDARNALARTKPDLDRRLFEASFSGPLPGRRTTFLLTGERLINDESAVVNARTLAGPLVQNVPVLQRRTSLLGRLDARLNEMHTLTARYDSADESERNRGVGGFRLPDQAVDSAERSHKLVFSEQAITSASFLNEFRLLFERETRRTGRAANEPAVLVRGAFAGGPSQLFQADRRSTVEIQNIASYFGRVHTLRMGGRFRPRSIHAIDGSNFGGTFEFSGLDQFARGTPFLFRANQGRPELDFSQHEAYGFLQDEIKLAPAFRVTLGLRYDWQSNIRDRNNFAPRLALAFAPGKQKTVMRAGAGLFFARVPESVIQRALLSDGVRIRELVISAPSFPDPFKDGETSLTPPSKILLAPGLRAPYVMQASLSVERELWSRTQGAVEYQFLRGVHQLRERNINAPLPETGLRPEPNALNMNQVESSAAMRGHALSATFRTHIVRRARMLAQYTLSRTTNDTSGPFALPADNFDLRSEMGRADFDRRHRFNLAGTLELPADFRVSAILTLASGAPFDITTGSDDNGDTVANDRPAGVTRNTGQGPGLARLDLRIGKLFGFPRPIKYRDHNSKNFEVSVDLFNAFNHTNLDSFVGVRGSPFFGRANSALPARTIQFSTRYSF